MGRPRRERPVEQPAVIPNQLVEVRNERPLLEEVCDLLKEIRDGQQSLIGKIDASGYLGR